MELTGTIDFPAGKMVVIYGSNQQGKTNVINAVRYAFLKDVFGRAGRSKTEYDERTLPRRDELVFGDSAEIEVSFLSNGIEYALIRSVQSKGKRETSKLYRADSPDEKIDVEPFLRTRLKVSLLDALFAPEIAQGFKQLYSGDIEEAVSRMFKDITTLRELATAFMARLNRLREAAEAERVRIETSYGDFRDSLTRIAPTSSSLKGFEELRKFEAGRIFAKLDSFYGEVQRFVERLKEEGLESDIEEKIEKAKQLAKFQVALDEQEAVIQKIGQLRDASHDWTKLMGWIRLASSVKNVGSRLKPTPRLRDEKLLADLEGIARNFTTAKEKRKQAEELAKKEKVNIESVGDLLESKTRVIKLLSAETRIGSEVAASVTKSGGKVYAILPFKLLEKDPSFGEISRQPIPKGDKKERRKHLESLKRQQRRLKEIEALQTKSERLFQKFVEEGMEKLNNLGDQLSKQKDGLKEDINRWTDELAGEASSFTGRNIRKRSIASANTATEYAKAVESAVSAATSRHLAETNRTLKDLGINATTLEQAELRRVLAQVRAQRGELPQIEQLEDELSKKKEEWRGVDEEYGDYAQVPNIVGETIAVVKQILSKCFDEGVLRKEISETYNEIIRILKERRLIQATAEIGPQELKSVVTYKGKRISHPAGSEKSFFSLAILTALAHFFQTPVLIDEVANNLDSKNLRAFFELVNEFKDRFSVQYVLSIKQTNDFDLDGWVKELRDEIVVHEISDKNIQKLQIQ